MNPYLKGFLIILASALGAGAAVAATTHDLWPISLAVIMNISATTIALLTQSPLPRKEWTEEERAVKEAATPPTQKVTP